MLRIGLLVNAFVSIWICIGA